MASALLYPRRTPLDACVSHLAVPAPSKVYQEKPDDCSTGRRARTYALSATVGPTVAAGKRRHEVGKRERAGAGRAAGFRSTAATARLAFGLPPCFMLSVMVAASLFFPTEVTSVVSSAWHRGENRVW
eukprot:c11987_g1_i1.p1 GENE.c11987_g1_i1~~c11987_g1_i1.p1  ORF type:complete len:128 (+),score=10.45 c11987_g1_i1:47-430(+)